MEVWGSSAVPVRKTRILQRTGAAGESPVSYFPNSVLS